ncbi:MAG: imidazoleglycerol-phosphate dehydratase HisB [Hyphomonadaceae bacterium]|nr:imidazoleglycerol-phosphate dehydratase HisB [Hyphomonadaceae bacterium]
MQTAPFAPLIAGGADLRRAPPSPDALRQRLADVYGVDAECVLPVRGAAHGVEVVLRRAALDGAEFADLGGLDDVTALARAYRFTMGAGGVRLSGALGEADARNALESGDGLLLLDERYAEFSDTPSLAALAARTDRLIVLRSLEIAYGLLGAPCAALIATPALIARLAETLEPNPLPTPVLRAAEAALDPVRAPAHAQQIALVKAERARIAAALNAREDAGPFVRIGLENVEQAKAAVRSFGIAGTWLGNEFQLDVLDPEANDRAIIAFGGAAPARAQRTADIVRETAETKIIAQVNLDSTAPVRIDTGIPFYDHMLQQVAVHGGFSLNLACKGDTEVDLHHTIEDCALALGQALSQALGQRRGIGRYGFMLPMDEAEAKISIDLGGRPYLVFSGAFTAPLLGGYPTEMTEHVFRSLSQTMGAAIHLEVKGENDHHKTEACFKAFGRALRQGLRIEGEAIPSSKGVL